MKLEEALRKIIRQFGVSVLQEKRLMFILSDFRAFNDHPAVKQVFQSIVSDGSGKKLCSLFLDDDSEGCLSFASSLKKSLAEDRHFKQELADYAVDSITFAMGLQTTVSEPADHGFDPMDSGNAEGRGSAETDKKTVNVSRSESTPADARVKEHPHREEPKPAGSSSGSRDSSTVAEAQSDTVAVKNSSTFRMKWLAVLVLIAGAFAFGRLGGRGSVKPEPVQVRPAEVSMAGNAAQGSSASEDRGSAGNDMQAARTADPLAGKYEYDKGWNYERGLGVRQDYAKALEWYRKAADLGNEAARTRIEAVETLISRNNEGPGQGPAGAGQVRSDAGGEGEIEALALGNRYFNEKNYAEAVKYYRKAAELGNVDAQTTLGWMYDQAKGVRRNYAEAAKWYRKAAEQGYAYAQNELGVLYYNGQGVKRNYGEALKWFRKAAGQGNAVSYGWLGTMYYEGQGVKKDYSEALKWFRKAADQGDAVNQVNLGWMYENGQGVRQNNATALKWYRKAAAQGDAEAKRRIRALSQSSAQKSKGAGHTAGQYEYDQGWKYEHGNGVRQDYSKAWEWYRKAAERGNGNASYRMEAMEQLINRID